MQKEKKSFQFLPISTPFWALRSPDLAFLGFPTVCQFSSSMIQMQQSVQSAELTKTIKLITIAIYGHKLGRMTMFWKKSSLSVELFPLNILFDFPLTRAT